MSDMPQAGSPPVQVPAHSHCEICKKAIKQGERFCGPECVAKNDELIAEKKKSMWKFVAIVAALMLFFTALNRGWI